MTNQITCPRCEEAISELKVSRYGAITSFTIDANGNEKALDIEEFSPLYKCPHCDFLLAADRNAAMKFLNTGENVFTN